MVKRLVSGILLLFLLLAASATSGLAAPAPQTRSVITYPQSGMTLGGTVEVTGIANHTSAQWWYDVSYAEGGEPTGGSDWISLSYAENEPVQDGVLAVWDTTTLPDGVYTLALTVKGQDDPVYWQYFVKNLTINNTNPPASPTPEPGEQAEEAAPEPVATVEAGPTPTPVTIEQPATSTPRVSPSPGGEEDAADETPTPATGDTDVGIGFMPDVGALRRGFCSGGLIALMLFLLWGLYVLGKVMVRWYLRQNAEPLSQPPTE